MKKRHTKTNIDIRMAIPQILEKLDNLIKHTKVWTEVEVTYLFVQTRKLLDHSRGHDNNDQYKHLRFYCDWVVHINKDKIDESTLDVLKNFEAGMKIMIGNNNLHAPGPINFAYFESMQAEVVRFLKEQGVEFKPFIKEGFWIDITSSLVKILENQPINIKPSYNMLIKSIEFQLSAPRTIWIRAIFNEPFKGADGKDYKFFDLKNAY
ncbi:hypothetical protein HGB07_03800 [Candidatus Roizmanbacteria bacterium]|nr:hypothetical protein [Candidatus Roizmanbacteria bacterium]